MATQSNDIDMKKVFESHSVECLENGQYQYLNVSSGKKEVKVISEEWGRKIASLCKSLKITPAHGNPSNKQFNADGLFIIGGHVRSMNGFELVDPYKFSRAEFKDGKEIDSVVLATFLNALAPLAITAEGAKALRVQYEAGLLDGSIPWPKKDGGSSQEKDDEVDPEIAARLSGGQARYAKSLAARQTVPLTFVFAEISDRLRVEWKLCQYWCNEDKKKKAAAAAAAAEGANLRSSIGGLLGGAKVLAMANDFNAKSPRQSETNASPELLQETAGLLTGKPTRGANKARAARQSVDSAV